MKWWEVSEDLGDGSRATRRFRTEEEAVAYATDPEREDYCMDGDGNGVREVDTDSRWFWTRV